MKAIYVATVVKKHILEFHIPYLRMLKEMGWETAVAARNDFEDPGECIIPYCDTYFDVPFERNPFHPGNIAAFHRLKAILDDGDYDVIHCHTPVGAMLTRLAAGDARRRGGKVFYTAHGFHFYKGAPLVNWLLYYPVERLLARRTDVLITITEEDYRRARRFPAGRVEYIPGIGVDRSRFRRVDPARAAQLRDALGIPRDARVILTVGELIPRKNHGIVVRALPELPDAWYVLCGSGPMAETYGRLAGDLGVADRFIMTGYRTDVESFYAMADVFVLPSLQEGLPVVLMEAMAAGLVCVASRNRGTDDLLGDSRLLFDARDLKALLEKLRLALSADCRDEISRNAARLERFDLAHPLSLVRRFYLSAVQSSGGDDS